MIDGKSVVALIPARAGSKRLPGKNIRDLAGKPLIAWTIEAAKACKYIDRVVVSTDDQKVAEIAERYGAEIPFLRPAELASDTASTNDVILHFIKQLNDDRDSILVLLQPTSPLRRGLEIDAAMNMLVEKGASGVVSVCECEHNPIWSGMIDGCGSMLDFNKEEFVGVRSQDLPSYHRINGAIYIYSMKSIVDNEGIFYSKDVYAYEMTREMSVDIDTRFDFDCAEMALRGQSE